MSNKKFHKHIDNGGITFCLESKQNGGSLLIETQYFGYPSVSSEFNDWGQMTADDYRNIGAMFIEFAATLDYDNNGDSTVNGEV